MSEIPVNLGIKWHHFLVIVRLLGSFVTCWVFAYPPKRCIPEFVRSWCPEGSDKPSLWICIFFHQGSYSRPLLSFGPFISNLLIRQEVSERGTRAGMKAIHKVFLARPYPAKDSTTHELSPLRFHSNQAAIRQNLARVPHFPLLPLPKAVQLKNWHSMQPFAVPH